MAEDHYLIIHKDRIFEVVNRLAYLEKMEANTAIRIAVPIGLEQIAGAAGNITISGLLNSIESLGETKDWYERWEENYSERMKKGTEITGEEMGNPVKYYLFGSSANQGK